MDLNHLEPKQLLNSGIIAKRLAMTKLPYSCNLIAIDRKDSMTLQSLALRYGCSVSDIKILNAITSDSMFFLLKNIIVPDPTTETAMSFYRMRNELGRDTATNRHKTGPSIPSNLPKMDNSQPKYYSHQYSNDWGGNFSQNYLNSDDTANSPLKIDTIQTVNNSDIAKNSNQFNIDNSNNLNNLNFNNADDTDIEFDRPSYCCRCNYVCATFIVILFLILVAIIYMAVFVNLPGLPSMH